MTESEVSDALDAKPTRRQGEDVVWDTIGGARPGGAVGRFVDDRLVRIEYVTTVKPSLPRLDRATADSVTMPEYVRRSVARTLRISDIEAVTRTPGHRMSWIIARGADGRTTVSSRWIWEVQPGGEVLFVPDDDGNAGQPVMRTMR